MSVDVFGKMYETVGYCLQEKDTYIRKCEVPRDRQTDRQTERERERAVTLT